MTKRSTSKGRAKSTAQSQKTRTNQILAIGAVVTVVILACVYMVTGSDLFGLFTEVNPTSTVQAMPTSSGGTGDNWWHVYFTDPNNLNDPDQLEGTVAEKLIQHINSANKTIHVASFEFNLTPVAEALIAAHKRGVEVQWVTDDEYGLEEDEEEDHEQFAMLKKAGIKVRADDREALMHNKFWIFDGQIVLTGSTNATVNGMFRNNNNIIVIDAPRLAAIYEREFTEMWKGEFGPTSPSTVGNQRVTANGTPIQVLFAPEDEVGSKVVELLETARDSIYFMAFSFTHEEIGATVLARAQAGIEVRGIFETRGSETEYSELPLLYCAGVPVRQDGNPRTFHHKVFVIDKETVITGSFNFSANADERNDENVIVITNRDIASRYLQEFDRRWMEANEPDAADMKCK